MVKVMKFALVCLVVAGLAYAAAPVFAQEKVAPQITSVSGEVVSVDLVKSEVVIKQSKDAVTGTYENTAFTAAPETKIAKGDTALQLSDLKAGDKVSVKYSSDDILEGQKVESILVETEEALPTK